MPSHRQPDRLGPTDQNDFNPLVQNGHLQTILARFWPPLFDFRRYPGQACLFTTEPGVRVLAWLHQHQIPSISHGVRDTLVIVHGLEGSADASYVLKTTAIALERGFDVLRLNIRTCGGTEHLSQKPYHSGLTNDLRSVCEQLSNRRLFMIGFSMGGNMTLKLAGEWEASTPTHIRGACVVSPPIDLSVCAHRIGEKYNRIYERRFLKSLQKKLKEKGWVIPSKASSKTLGGIRSLIDFDNFFTAPAFGFQDATDYYNRASSIHFLNSIRIPTLVIQSQDDPLVPFELFRHRSFGQNTSLTLESPAHGGHVAFLSRGPFRFWASWKIVCFCEGLRNET